MSEAVACKPNFSASGRRRRRRVGYAGAILTVAMMVAFAVLHTAWYWRTSVAVPASMAAFGWLQATRNTCVAHAARGTFEQDDFSATKADDADVAASRKVAATIRRDALIVAVLSAAIGVGAAFLGL